MRHERAARSWAPIWVSLVVSACQFTTNDRELDAGSGGVTVGFAAATSPMLDEKSGAVPVTVVLSAPSDRPVTVRCAVTSGTATAGEDYQLDGNAVGFSPGETEKTITVMIVQDTLEEPNETIVLGLESPIGAEVGVASHTLTISANILPRITFGATTSSANEAAATTLDVSLDMASSTTLQVDYVLGGTAFASADYGLASGTLVFPPGTTMQQLALAEIDDALDEDDETVIVGLSNPVNVILGAVNSTTHTIVDNDAQPTIGFAATATSQGELVADATTTVTLSAASGRTVTVSYAQVGGTAGAGDVTVTPGVLTFAPGEVSHALPVTIIDDALDEDNETVPIELTAPVNATLGAAVHTLTIVDDDATPSVAFTTATTTASEAGGAVTLTVQLSAASGRTVTVPFAATGASTAVTPGDYSYGATAALSFPAGTTSRTITVNVVSDAIDEDSEQLITALSTPTNATLGAIASHTLTITDDDSPPSVSFDPTEVDGQANEGNTGTTVFDYHVVLNAASGKTVTVPITFSGDAETPGDYTTRPSDVPVVFAPGQTKRTIRITVIGDTVNEPGVGDTIIMTIPTSDMITNATQGTPNIREHLIVDDD